MQTKITCFDKVREDLRRTLKFVGDMSFMFFSLVCSLRPPKIEDVGIHDMFCFEIRNSNTPDPRLCKHYSVRKREDIKIRTRPILAFVKIMWELQRVWTPNVPKHSPKTSTKWIPKQTAAGRVWLLLATWPRLRSQRFLIDCSLGLTSGD